MAAGVFPLASVCYANPTEVHATAGVKTAYDDNITYTSTNRLSDFVTNLEAGLNILQQGPTHQLSIKTDVIEEIFAHHGGLDNTAEGLNLDFKQNLSKHDKIELTDVLNHSYSPTSFQEAFGRTNGYYGTLTNETGISYTHDYSSQLSQEAHFNDTISQASKHGFVDSVLYQGGTKLSYSMDSADIFSQSYDYTQRDFRNGPNASINSLVTGYRRYFTPQFYADLGVGPDFIHSFQGKDNIKPHFLAALTDDANANTKVSLTFEKHETTGIYTENLFDSWQVALNLNQQLTQRLSAYMSAFYGEGRYDAIDVHTKFAGVQTQLNFAINKRTTLALGYSFSDSQSNSSSFSYKKNYVFLSVNVTF